MKEWEFFTYNDPDTFLTKICKNVGKIYREHGTTVCQVGNVTIKATRTGLVFQTPDSEFEAPWRDITYCNAYIDKETGTKQGYCKFRHSGGVFIEARPSDRGITVIASKGPIYLELGDVGQIVPIKE